MRQNYSHIYVFATVLVLCILFLAPYPSVNAQQTSIPPGSYKKSCRNIQVLTGGTLLAQCEKSDGTYKKSTLRFTQCEGDISNNNGQLSCKSKPGKQPPAGSYRATCKDIGVDGKKLKAKCERTNGSWHKTEIKYKNCKGDIRNDDGVLRCNGGGGKIPKGSYRDTCKNSYVEGSMLYSKCKKKNGSWRNSSINYKKCNKDIKNDNGRLTCGKSGSDFPKGSYKKSCKNLYMEGKLLEADCKNKNGKWKHSSIKYKNCNKGIWNDSGKLRCNK